jgi:predicted nucleic acid-binding protein
MAIKVVDASALAALIFHEDDADAIDRQLAGAVLVAPALLRFEMTNVCRTKLRQYPDQRDILLDQFSLQAAMSVETHDVNHLETLALSERLGLTTYDASYLWLARELSAELVTLDRQLARAVAALRHP